MGQHSALVTVPLLLVSVITVHSSGNVNLQADFYQSLDMFDGSGRGSGQVTSAEVTDTQTETNSIEESALSSSNESVYQQKHFLSNEVLSSIGNSGTLHSVSNLQLFSEDNSEVSLKASFSKINSTDLITEGGGKSEFLQQLSKQIFSPLLEFDDSFNINRSEDDSASFKGSNSSYFAATHVPPQHPADVSVGADSVAVIKGDVDVISSQNDKNNVSGASSEQTLVGHSFNQSLKDVPTVHPNQTADNQSNADVKEIQVVNLENYNRSESRSQAVNESVEDHQEQSDSPTAHHINISFESEETFQKVFNISVDDTVDREQKQYFDYQTGSEENAKKIIVSNVKVSRPEIENSTADYNVNSNDFSVLNNAFEVHHYSRKPEPDNVNGATQNETLAQYIEELVLNKLLSLDNQKDSQLHSVEETDSEIHEEDDIPLGAEISPDEINESDDEGTQRGATLAFVFDSTGSMWDDLVQVKMGAERIMAAMLERPDKPIYNYVLVPFHDPGKLSQPYLLNSWYCKVHIWNLLVHKIH
jgi:hypothetical protein